MTGDSGMVSGSNSTVTDTDRRYLDVEGLEDSGKSTPSERSRDDLESGSPNQIDKIDILDFSNNGNFSDQDFDDNFVKEKSKPSKLPKVLPKERSGPEIWPVAGCGVLPKDALILIFSSLPYQSNRRDHFVDKDCIYISLLFMYNTVF